MAEIKTDVIKNLDIVATGAYGAVYQIGDDMYKIYFHPQAKPYREKLFPRLSWERRIKRLMHRRLQISHTDLIHDVINIDHKFSGVIGTFYSGTRLLNVKSQVPFTIKKEICYTLIQNIKELTDHHIYPLDCSLCNIIYTDQGEVKVIDLDDETTIVTLFKKPFYERQSAYALKRTIMSFLDGYHQYPCDWFTHQITRDFDTSIYYPGNKRYATYEEIAEYIEGRSEEMVFAICDIERLNNTIMAELKWMADKTDIHIVPFIKLTNNSESAMHNAKMRIYLAIKELAKMGIIPFDIIIEKANNTTALADFFTSYNTISYYTFDHNNKLNYNEYHFKTYKKA